MKASNKLKAIIPDIPKEKQNIRKGNCIIRRDSINEFLLKIQNFFIKKNIMDDCAYKIKLICVMHLLTAQKRWVGEKLHWDKEMITDCKVV